MGWETARSLLVVGLVMTSTGCEDPPTTVVETRLPAETSADERETLLASMCEGMNPDTGESMRRVKVIFYRPGGETAFERTYRCDRIPKGHDRGG